MNAPPPFRVGTTSFIIPADYGPNIQFLAGKTEDIALLFFESLKPNTELSWLEEARTLQDRHDLTFTVHLPADIRLASTRESLRAQAIASCETIMRMLAPLQPKAYVCHADGDSEQPLNRSELTALSRSLIRLGECCGDASRICVENVRESHDTLRPALQDSGASICYDLGHAILRDQPVLQELRQWLPHCRVLHLHGVKEGRDHHPLSELPPHLLQEVLEIFGSPEGPPNRTLTLELFHRDRWESSVRTLNAMLAEMNRLRPKEVTR
ncbi:cobamide remodeling phosphodiesterase CbiR [Puniceicoccus vermicola]|uniref:Sugar phosphate isomerase/epimerase n=1 Tax=Puniceicoccus vermicola TaxID=388746 RepID=A0A7X1AZK4_9BACT|nr:cobamide remodeling phosphodiesterase CbiR [Puniceicoccus vermicola]MBC2602881.1 sugar phosphate isomerase/epimerase [Puniceicoccus vermicola]